MQDRYAANRRGLLPVVGIVGPTSAGKTALAVQVGLRVSAEVVSADSRQVYRYMDIGTAKPSLQDRSSIPHHLLDIVDPDQEYNLALFLRHSTEAIQDIQRRSKLPLLVGGTGQYIWSLVEGWQVPKVPPNPELRRHLERKARLHGAPTLHHELAGLDPAAADRIDGRNLRRVIRALELYYSSPDQDRGPPRKVPPPYVVKVLGLTLDRPARDRRINERVEAMIELGWSDEVRMLLEKGYTPELPSLSSLGYPELIRHFRNELSLKAAVEEIKRRTRKFSRRQYAWFQLSDARIQWHNPMGNIDLVEEEVAQWI